MVGRVVHEGGAGGCVAYCSDWALCESVALAKEELMTLPRDPSNTVSETLAPKPTASTCEDIKK